MGLKRFIFRRLVEIAVIFFVIMTILFVLFRLAPGDPVSRMVDPSMTPEDARLLMERMGLRLVEGRFPEAGQPGAVLHVALARARSMELGDVFGRIVRPEDTTPGRFELVGLLEVVKQPADLGVRV